MKKRVGGFDFARAEEAAAQNAEELEWRLRAGILIRDKRITLKPAQRKIFEGIAGGISLEEVAHVLKVSDDSIVNLIMRGYKHMVAQNKKTEKTPVGTRPSNLS